MNHQVLRPGARVLLRLPTEPKLWGLATVEAVDWAAGRVYVNQNSHKASLFQFKGMPFSIDYVEVVRR